MTDPDVLGLSAPSTSEEAPPAHSATAGADHALEVLLAVRARIAPELPEELLRQCYAIQKQFQFDRDEQLPLVRTRRLVEGFVEREAEASDWRTEEDT